MHAILLVDEDLRVLARWAQALHAVQPNWSVRCASSRQETLRLLRETAYDAVAIRAGMPGADGLLLEEVRDRHPDLLRIALCALDDRVAIGPSADIAHRVIATSCEPHRLVAAVTQATALRDRLQDEALRRVVAGLHRLPSLPALYRELVDELRSPEASMIRAANLITKDLGMSSKILQLVNSAYFGFAEPIVSPARAVVLLGLDALTSLVLALGVFSQFQGGRHAFFTLEVLWRHSLATGKLARAIAQEEHTEPAGCDQAFTAGLLHDLGPLVLATNLPDLYTDALALAGNERMPEWDAERAVFGTTHADVGAYLLGLWGVGAGVVEAVAYHHEPDQAADAGGLTPLVATHVADALEYEAHAGLTDQPSSLLREDYVAQRGFRDRFPIWLAHGRKAVW